MRLIRINNQTINLDRVNTIRFRQDDGGEQIDFELQPTGRMLQNVITVCKGENDAAWDDLLGWLDVYTEATFNL